MKVIVKTLLTITVFLIGAFGQTIIITVYGLSFGFIAAASTITLLTCMLIWRYPTNIIKGFANPDWGNNERDVYGLKAELLRRINPKNFLSPYDYDKIICSNTLISKLNKIDVYDIAGLKEIRKAAESSLDIKLDTNPFYNHIMTVLSPIKFSGNQDLFIQMTKLCQLLSDVKNEDIDSIESVLVCVNNDIIEPLKDKKFSNRSIITLLVFTLVLIDVGAILVWSL